LTEGSSFPPRERRADSRQPRNCMRWPPAGNWIGGCWVPSLDTRMRVPDSSRSCQAKKKEFNGHGFGDEHGRLKHFRIANCCIKIGFLLFNIFKQSHWKNI
jgi:hypothetical protein